MKKNLKFNTLILTLPLLLGGMVGCGNPGSTSDSTSEKVEIVFWHTFNQSVVDVLKTKIETFKQLIKEHDGIDVTIKLDQAGSYDDIKTKISNGFAVDNYPTLAVAYPDHVANYLYDGSASNKQYVVNLDDFINDSEIGFGKETWLGDVYGADDFVYDFYREGSQYAVEGTYSLPFMKSTEIMYYNLTLLKEALQYYKPEIADSETKIVEYIEQISWEEFMNLCANIKENSSKINNLLEYPAYYDSDANLFITKMYQEGIPYASIKDEKGNIDFETGEAFTKTETLLKELRQAHQDNLITTKGIVNKYGSDYFTNEKTIFSIGSSGGAGYNFPDAEAFELGICKVPASNNTPLYVTQGPTLTMFNNFVLSPEQNQRTLECTWKFLKYITNGVVNAELCVNGSEGYVPVRYSAYETETFVYFMEEGEDYAKCYDVVLNDINQGNGGYLVSPTFRGSAELRENCGTMLTACLNAKSETEVTSLLQKCINDTKMFL